MYLVSLEARKAAEDTIVKKKPRVRKSLLKQEKEINAQQDQPLDLSAPSSFVNGKFNVLIFGRALLNSIHT